MLLQVRQKKPQTQNTHTKKPNTKKKTEKNPTNQKKPKTKTLHYGDPWQTVWHQKKNPLS